MTVAELIAELQKYDGKLEVITQGCDCDGDVARVTNQEDYIYIERDA